MSAKPDTIAALTLPEMEQLQRGRPLEKAREHSCPPLKWTEVPNRRGVHKLRHAARATVTKGGDLHIVVSGEAARKLSLKPRGTYIVMHSGECLAFRAGAYGFVAGAGAAKLDPDRCTFKFQPPQGWARREVHYRLARSGDDYYLEPVGK